MTCFDYFNQVAQNREYEVNSASKIMTKEIIIQNYVINGDKGLSITLNLHLDYDGLLTTIISSFRNNKPFASSVAEFTAACISGKLSEEKEAYGGIFARLVVSNNYNHDLGELGEKMNKAIPFINWEDYDRNQNLVGKLFDWDETFSTYFGFELKDLRCKNGKELMRIYNIMSKREYSHNSEIAFIDAMFDLLELDYSNLR